MPEIDSKVSYFKSTIKDFLDLIEKKAAKEKVLTTDMGCRRTMQELEAQAKFQKKLFGVL
jgi:hypothetical protein